MARCKLTKKENTIYVETARLVTWEDAGGRVRVPKPAERSYNRPLPFRVGVWPYLHPRLLAVIPIGKKGVYRDGYGRKTFAYRERFPCFDRYDRACEKRYYHWVYRTAGGRLYCVYFEDEDREIEVTADVATVPGEHYDAMCAAGLVDEEGYLHL